MQGTLQFQKQENQMHNIKAPLNAHKCSKQIEFGKINTNFKFSWNVLIFKHLKNLQKTFPCFLNLLEIGQPEMRE